MYLINEDISDLVLVSQLQRCRLVIPSHYLLHWETCLNVTRACIGYAQISSTDPTALVLMADHSLELLTFTCLGCLPRSGF